MHTLTRRILATGIGASIAATLVVGSAVATTSSHVPPAATAQQAPPAPSLVIAAPIGRPVPISPPAPSQAPPSSVAPTPFVPAPVARLTSLAAPDAWVQLPRPVTSSELAAVKAIPALQDVTIVSTGTVNIDGSAEKALAVDPSTFRRVTPGPTAMSDALWSSIAAGNLATELTHDALPSTLVGQAIQVQGRGTRKIRLGALAAFGFPGSSVVMSLSRGVQLGLTPMSGLVISAPTVSPDTLVAELAEATGGHVDLLGPDAAEADIAGGTTAKGLPATWNGLFQQAANSCPGMSWTVLAAIGQIESGDGQNDGPSSKGAVGPMQFLPATFEEYAVDGDHDGKKNPLDAYDAVPTAARMLCTDGAGAGPAQLKAALFDYNHADWYVAEVLALAARYR